MLGKKSRNMGSGAAIGPKVTPNQNTGLVARKEPGQTRSGSLDPQGQKRINDEFNKARELEQSKPAPTQRAKPIPLGQNTAPQANSSKSFGRGKSMLPPPPPQATRATGRQVLEMAVGREKPNLRYDSNKDGKITAADALAVEKANRGTKPMPSSQSFGRGRPPPRSGVTKGLKGAPRVTAEQVLRMAVGREKPNLRYDSNKDGKITAADALAIAKTSGRRMKKGGSVKSSASKRADGITVKGKTKGRMV